ncbi:DUF6226 family protein [Sporichthya polymorpha]|uniref:DUF6226 family protein n=1 Tax=Sporichthya polymorpha TaxID=35751 RepID=UPI00036BE8DC|nr:DUF6226 family protein [Sporichthya polymorpha]
MDSSVLRAATRDAFKKISVHTPGWEDPRPNGEPPDDADYEKCDDPGKFRILAARAEAWSEALTQTGLAERENLEPAEDLWRELPESPPEIRIVRLRPKKAASVPLVFGFGWLMGEPEAYVVVGAGEPAAVISLQPQCACDACDIGSDLLVQDFDDIVMNIVSGQLVHVTTDQFTIHTSPQGPVVDGQVAGQTTADLEQLFADARAGKSQYPSVYGARWW